MAARKANNSSCSTLLYLIFFLGLSFFNHFIEKDLEQDRIQMKKQGHRPLSLAQKLKNFNDSQLLQMLDEPGFISRKDSGSGRNLLHVACELNRPELAKKLIEKGFSINQPDNRSFTPIMIALISDSRPCVELLMEHNPDLTIDCRQRYPIHSAAQRGYLHVVKESLRQGVDVNSRTQSGRHTPLHLAAKNGKFDIVVLLIENGANPSSTMSYGWTPGDLAFKKYKHISLYLQNKGGALNVGQLQQEFELVDGWPLPGPDEMKNNTSSTDTTLFAAVLNDDLEAIKNAGANENFDGLNRAGTPLLCFALLNKKFAAAQLILNKIKKIDQTDMASRTALICATIGENEELASDILARNANPSSQDLTGNTALHYAVKTWQNQLVIKLINAGAEVFAVNLLQQGPQHIAAETGNLQIVEFLLQNGCDINLDDARGNTVLHLAAAKGNLPMVERLLKSGANPHIKNIAGKKAADLVPGGNSALKAILANRVEIEGTNPVKNAPAEINLQLPKVALPSAEAEN